MAVTTRFTGNPDDLIAAQERIKDSATGVSAVYKELSRETRQAAQIAEQAMKRAETETDKYKREIDLLNQAQKLGSLSADDHRRAVDQLNKEFDEMTNVSSRAADQLGRFSPDNFLSLDAALDMIQESYRNWIELQQIVIQNDQEIVGIAERVAGESTALAGLAERGEGRDLVKRVAETGAEFGTTMSQEMFDAFQDQISIAGDQQQGIARGRALLLGQEVGIRLGTGSQLERAGAAVQAAPGAALAQAFAIGEASQATPETLATASGALALFGDTAEGLAVAGQLAGQFSDNLNTMTKAAGTALQSTGGLEETFADLGVSAASPIEKIEALSQAGIDTAEELDRAGIGEVNQQIALANLITNVGNVRRLQGVGAVASIADLEQQRAELLLDPNRAAIERLQEQRARRQIEQVFGGRAGAAFSEEQERLGLGRALERTGRDVAGVPLLGFLPGFESQDLVDEGGRAAPDALGARFRTNLGEGFASFGPQGILLGLADAVREGLDTSNVADSLRQPNVPQPEDTNQ